MSQDFSKVLIKDDRLNVSDQIKYGVIKGGQNMTPSVFTAISQSTTSHTYNVQVPSEQTIIDRRVLWKSEFTLQIVSNAPAGSSFFRYGLDSALAPFPLHQLTSIMTATINNNSVSINMRDVLPAILRFNDRRALARYNGYTPTAYDTVGNYNDAVGSNQNVLGQWINNTDNDLVPRGSWAIKSITGAGGGAVPVPNGTPQTLLITFEVSEPLLISPFIFCDPKSNNQGFYGIQNLNFVFNIGSPARVFRSVSPFIQSISLTQFNNSQLIFNFLTPHPSDLIPARNAVPYYELPRYISSGLPAFGAFGSATDTQIINSQNVQLNQIPDKLILFVRKAQGIQTNSDADFFLTIKSVSINFNNQSGILASATPQDLYRYSVESGSNQSWYEFSGRATSVDLTNLTAGSKTIPTAGSLLVLEFGRHIQLVEDFYASGSLGSFNLQVRLEVQNQQNNAFTAGQCELVMITMNSGVFVCERGTSSVFTGLLTKQDVLDASTQEAYTMSDTERLVGGGFLDNLKSVSGKLLPKLPSVAKSILGSVDNKYAKAGADVLGALGYGMSGAGMSAGGMSAGGVSGAGVSGAGMSAGRAKLMSRVM
jgi:hypothetical protein